MNPQEEGSDGGLVAIFFFFFFFVELGLNSGLCTLALVILEMGSAFLPGVVWTVILLV
jgi:hypothetical protein